jgi:undecaprenyl-diphosphatase
MDSKKKKNKVVNVFMIISLIIFIIICYLLLTNKLSIIDNYIYNSISRMINNTNTEIMKGITSFGNVDLIILISFFILVLLINHPKYYLYGPAIFFVAGSSDAISFILKDIFHRSRPDVLRLVTENSYSFPSAHSLVSICFYGIIIYQVIKMLKGKSRYIVTSLLVLLIILIGLSRIYLGVHYFSDIIGGYCIGFIWLIVCIRLIKRFLKQSK